MRQDIILPVTYTINTRICSTLARVLRNETRSMLERGYSYCESKVVLVTMPLLFMPRPLIKLKPR